MIQSIVLILINVLPMIQLVDINILEHCSEDFIHFTPFIVKWIESSLQCSSPDMIRYPIDCIQDVKYERKETLFYLGLVTILDFE